jgi:hypothetical protein
LTNADPHFFASAAACACLILWATAGHAQNPTRTVAQFSRGDIRFTQGGTAYSAQLSAGRIDVTEELAGEAPLEIRTLHLQFTLLGGRPGAQPDVVIVLKNADGPRMYEAQDLLALTVQTSGGGTSMFQAGRGTCAFILIRLSRSGVEGTARCDGTMAGTGGEPGLLVTDLAFSASP